MINKRIIKIGLKVIIAGAILGALVVLYLFNMPHRDVQSVKADFTLSASEIVAEYLSNGDAANAKYLSEDGQSKILIIIGTIAKISEDFSGQKVVLLKEANEEAGVSASFTLETNVNAENLKVGDIVSVKGVIRSGASYDEDLELYENVVLDKVDLVK